MGGIKRRRRRRRRQRQSAATAVAAGPAPLRWGNSLQVGLVSGAVGCPSLGVGAPTPPPQNPVVVREPEARCRHLRGGISSAEDGVVSLLKPTAALMAEESMEHQAACGGAAPASRHQRRCPLLTILDPHLPNNASAVSSAAVRRVTAQRPASGMQTAAEQVPPAFPSPLGVECQLVGAPASSPPSK